MRFPPEAGVPSDINSQPSRPTASHQDSLLLNLWPLILFQELLAELPGAHNWDNGGGRPPECKQGFSPPNTHLKIAAKAIPKVSVAIALAPSWGFPQAKSWLRKFGGDSANKNPKAEERRPFFFFLHPA